MATPKNNNGKTDNGWKAKLEQELPLLGHRNWIVIADSAYPWQTSPGVETVETHEDHLKVLKTVLQAFKKNPHVRPIIMMDSELAYVTEQDAPGAGKFKPALHKVLEGHAVETMLHEKIIGKLDEVGKTFHVLLLKTNLTIPYTSVFLQLDCKYWSAEAERKLRERMSNAAPSKP